MMETGGKGGGGSEAGVSVGGVDVDSSSCLMPSAL